MKEVRGSCLGRTKEILVTLNKISTSTHFQRKSNFYTTLTKKDRDIKIPVVVRDPLSVLSP